MAAITKVLVERSHSTELIVTNPTLMAGAHQRDFVVPGSLTQSAAA